MHSLQNAVEQYRLDNGVVPMEPNDLIEMDSASDYHGYDNLSTFLSGLVPKYISNIPHSPKWPNNFIDGTHSYSFGYMTYSASITMPSYGWAHYCGDKPIDKYMIYFTASDRILDLQRGIIMYDGISTKYDVFSGEVVGSPTDLPKTYCIFG